MSDKNIIIFGAPGAGKGTISNLLEEKIHIMHLSTGDILRREVEANTELGNSVERYTSSGELVPDDIIVDVLISILKSKHYFIKTKGFVLDGFPRNLNQARLLSDSLKNLDLKIDLIIYLYVKNRKILVDRLTSRFVCKSCERSYNKIFSPSKVDGICDMCGGELYRRVDDDEKVVENRIDLYENNFAPLMKFFEREDITIKRVDAGREINVIVTEIIDHLNN